MSGWEQEAVARTRSGQPEAYTRLVERYSAPIHHAVEGILGDSDRARDVTQQAFVSAYEHLDSYDPRRRFFSWIFRIALNEALNSSRRARRRCRLEGLDPPAAEPSPEQNLLDRERAADLRDAVRDLPEKYRKLVNLHYFQNLPYVEIAGTLGLPPTTVKSRLHTALLLLRAEFARREAAPPSTWARSPGPPSRRPGRCAPAP